MQMRSVRGKKKEQPQLQQQPADTTKQPAVNNNNQQPTNYNPYGNIPIKMEPTVGGFRIQ